MQAWQPQVLTPLRLLDRSPASVSGRSLHTSAAAAGSKTLHGGQPERCGHAPVARRERPSAALRPPCSLCLIVCIAISAAARARGRPSSQPAGAAAWAPHARACAPTPLPRPAARRGFASSALPETTPEAKAAPKPKAAAGVAAPAAPAIDVQSFVLENVRRYDGDGSFLAPATDRTLKLWDEVQVRARLTGVCGDRCRAGLGCAALAGWVGEVGSGGGAGWPL